MSWGTDLWDQFENLDKHTQWGIDFLERYAKFVKERLEIEQTYAKQLRSLVKKYCPKRSKDDEPRFTSCLSFYAILNELNDYAGQREVVAEDMGHKVYGELMRYSQDLKAERKHHLQEGRKAQQYLEQCWKQMDNSKKKFERECREAEKSQIIFERLDNDINATKSEVEKAKAQLYLRTHMADESKNEYAAQLQNFNAEQWKHFNAAIPQIFKNLQDMDERRTVKLGETYRSFAEVERKVIPIISKCLEGMVTAAKNVDERRVSEGAKMGSCINLLVILILWVGIKSVSMSFQAPNLEDLSHLPPEQRRKKLQQRIDELSRELQKEMDQRDALNKMKDVYEKNPQMGDPGSLQPKISETICNMEKLRSEIHKNEVTSPVNQEHRSPPQPDPHEFDDEFDDDDPLPAIGHCKALYSFDGSNEGTLVMKEDEVLYVIEEDKGDGWTRVRKQSGEEGYVPTSYVEITLEKHSKGAVTYI
uniref:Formin-binding protein 1-like n=1 Tax=Pygocentrus nattereri TaxID=42514 RepID=A0AAR2JJ69_PYGNA